MKDGTTTAARIADHLKDQKQRGEVSFELDVIEVRREKGEFLLDRDDNAEIKEYAGTPDQIIPYVSDADVIAVHVGPISQSVIDAAPKLKLIACARGGPVNVNVKYATKRRIPVVYTPGRNADAVADLTIGMMIIQARNICEAAWDMKQDSAFAFGSERRPAYVGTELSGKTLGLVGLGAVGRRVVRRALAFDMEVLVHDPYVTPDLIEEVGAKPKHVDELLAESDFVSLHMRLTAETENFINRETLAKMKPTAYLINTARGGVVDEQALYDALSNGKIAGAALDVLCEEPPSKDNLLPKLDNVTVLPHIGGQTKEINERGAVMVVEDIMAFLAGNKPKRVINEVQIR